MKGLIVLFITLCVFGRGISLNCPAGQEPVESANSIFCSDCALGTYKSTEDDSLCLNCPLGTYSNSMGLSSCINCGLGSTTFIIASTSPQDCVCEKGFYGYPCSKCPDGAFCEGGASLPVPAEGHWTANNVDFLVCTPENACLGGEGSLCAKGYKDRMCAVCSDDHQRFEGECKECPSCPYCFVLLCLVLLIALLVFLFILSKVPISAVFFVALYFVQIIAVMPRLVADWGDSVRFVFAMLSFANLNIEMFTFECIFSNFSFAQKWGITVVLPGIVAVLFILSFHVHRLFLHNATFSDVLKLKWRYRHSMISFLIISYTVLVVTSLEIFDCTSQPDGTHSLDAAPSFTCYEQDWWILMPFAILPIGLYVLGLPLYSFFLLKNHLHLLTEGKFRSKYGVLFLRFRQQFWFWEIVLMVRKALTVGFIVMMSRYMLGQLFSLYVTLIGLVLQLKFRPFRLDAANRLEDTLLVFQFTVQLCVMLWQFRNTEEFDYSEDSLLFLLWVSLVCATLSIILFWVLEAKRLSKMRREERRIHHNDSDGFTPKEEDLFDELLPNESGVLVPFSSHPSEHEWNANDTDSNVESDDEEELRRATRALAHSPTATPTATATATATTPPLDPALRSTDSSPSLSRQEGSSSSLSKGKSKRTTKRVRIQGDATEMEPQNHSPPTASA